MLAPGVRLSPLIVRAVAAGGTNFSLKLAENASVGKKTTPYEGAVAAVAPVAGVFVAGAATSTIATAASTAGGRASIIGAAGSERLVEPIVGGVSDFMLKFMEPISEPSAPAPKPTRSVSPVTVTYTYSPSSPIVQSVILPPEISIIGTSSSIDGFVGDDGENRLLGAGLKPRASEKDK